MIIMAYENEYTGQLTIEKVDTPPSGAYPYVSFRCVNSEGKTVTGWCYAKAIKGLKAKGGDGTVKRQRLNMLVDRFARETGVDAVMMLYHVNP